MSDDTHDPMNAPLYRLLSAEDGRLHDRIGRHDERNQEEFAKVNAILKTHEEQLRDLMLWRAKIGGIVAAMAAAGGIGGSLVAQWLSRAAGLHP